MELSKEWYRQETIDSEEDKFHRPLGDEQAFLMLSVQEILTLYARIAKTRNLLQQKGLAYFHAIR